MSSAGTLTSGEKFKTQAMPQGDGALVPTLRKKNVTFSIKADEGTSDLDGFCCTSRCPFC